jgi:arylsulfatase A
MLKQGGLCLFAVLTLTGCGGGKATTAGSGNGGATADTGGAPSEGGAPGGAGAGGGVAGAGGEAGAGGQRPANRPNVIIVIADDLGYADVGTFGAPLIATPNIDRLATEGLKLTDFYVAAPICSPSRAALLTGSYPVRVGITDVLLPASSIGLNPEEVTIAELLKSVGYATAAVGKWHLGDEKTFLPTRQGFDEYFGLPYSNDMTPLPLIDGEEAIEQSPDLSQLTKRYTARAIDFITRNRQSPFFLYLAQTMPHTPIAASDAFKGHSADGLYGDVVEEIDWSVGQILETLDTLGIADETLVVFTSDNGPSLVYGNHAGSAKPLREGKWTTFEGGQREPGLMRWPNRIPADTVSDAVVTTMDLLPTIAAITGAALPVAKLDGKSVLPILERSPGAASPTDALYYYLRTELQAVRMGHWKLHLPHTYETVLVPGVDGVIGQDDWVPLPLSLFDLDVDPGETTNLVDQYPDVVNQLMNAATTFDADIKANLRAPGQL